MGRRYDIDWEAIERDYRLGLLSDRELGTKHKVDHATISRRAKKLGWTKDKTAEIQAGVRAALATQRDGGNTTPGEPTRRDIALAIATGYDVVLEHRTIIGRLRTAASKLLVMTEKAIGSLETEDAPTTMSERMRLLAQCNAAVTSVVNLAGVVNRTVPLERQAFSLDELKSGDGQEDWVDRVD